MLGSKRQEQLDLFVAGSLEQLIPEDHILFRVNRVLDSSCLREEGAAAGVRGGQAARTPTRVWRARALARVSSRATSTTRWWTMRGAWLSTLSQHKDSITNTASHVGDRGSMAMTFRFAEGLKLRNPLLPQG